MTRFYIVALVLLFAACAPRYRMIANEPESPALSENCNLQLLDKAPSAAFTILGTVEPENREKLAETPEQFLDAIRAAACKRAADAAITVKDELGRYTTATIIRMK